MTMAAKRLPRHSTDLTLLSWLRPNHTHTHTKKNQELPKAAPFVILLLLPQPVSSGTGESSAARLPAALQGWDMTLSPRLEGPLEN